MNGGPSSISINTIFLYTHESDTLERYHGQGQAHGPAVPLPACRGRFRPAVRRGRHHPQVHPLLGQGGEHSLGARQHDCLQQCEIRRTGLLRGRRGLDGLQPRRLRAGGALALRVVLQTAQAATLVIRRVVLFSEPEYGEQKGQLRINELKQSNIDCAMNDGEIGILTNNDATQRNGRQGGPAILQTLSIILPYMLVLPLQI